MKILITIMLLFAVATIGFAEQGAKKRYDPNKSLKNSLRLEGRLAGKSITKEKAQWIVSLPREIQVDIDSVILRSDVWIWVSEDERLVLMFAGNVKQGKVILDIREE